MTVTSLDLAGRREDLLADLMGRYDELCRTAWLITGDRGHAEDAVADAAASIWTSRSSTTVSTPSAYVTRSVVNAALKSLRAQRRRVPLVFADVDDRAASTDQLAQVDDAALIVNALRSLTERQRAVVTLLYLRDLPAEQVAEILGCSVGTVKSQAFKAMARMRQTLEEKR